MTFNPKGSFVLGKTQKTDIVEDCYVPDLLQRGLEIREMNEQDQQDQDRFEANMKKPGDFFFQAYEDHKYDDYKACVKDIVMDEVMPVYDGEKEGNEAALVDAMIRLTHIVGKMFMTKASFMELHSLFSQISHKQALQIADVVFEDKAKKEVDAN